MNLIEKILFEANRSDELDTLIKNYESMGCDLDIRLTAHNGLYLSLIRIPEDKRGTGLGKQIMSQLISFCDNNDLTMYLTPSNEFGSSKSKLELFYKKFGFVKNAGRNKDYRYSGTMIRHNGKA